MINFIKGGVEILQIDLVSFDYCRKMQHLLEKVRILGGLFRQSSDDKGCYIVDTKFLKKFELMNYNSLEDNNYERFKYFVKLFDTLQVIIYISYFIIIYIRRKKIPLHLLC